MAYPTDPLVLASLNDLEWDCLLAHVWNAPAPRRVVRMFALSDPATRRAYALDRKAKGDTQTEIAKALGISPSLLSKILSGKRT